VLEYDRADTSNVLHVATALNDTHVYMSGYNNSASDGWYPKTSVRRRLVGQLYLPP
jgi:hypothetical protein